MKKTDIIIAIDPDVDGSGVAVFAPEIRSLALHLFTLPELVEFFRQAKKNYDKDKKTYVVVVEASYLISANWHLSWDDSKNRAAAKGRQVGRNHEIGRQIVEFCRYMGIPYEEKLPLVKCWAGDDGKITTEELNSLLEGMDVPIIKGKINQEKRDAALIAIDRSGLPLRMTSTKKSQK